MDETFQQKSPAVDQKYKKCRACRRYLQKLSIAMASTSSQLPPENIGVQKGTQNVYQFMYLLTIYFKYILLIKFTSLINFI
jgi:hypothetical protein